MTEDFALPICIPVGNKKVGKVWTFSLPSIITCPGSSRWCRSKCYARRIEILRTNCRRAYMRNLALSQEPDKLVDHVLEHLPEDAKAVRIHVGGDFYSKPYIQSWIQICSERPATQFWSYTRSWNLPHLLPALETLRDISNVELIASTDPDMPLPPSNWRIAYIESDSRASGLVCPEQQNKIASCQKCRYCFHRKKGNVIFKIH